MNRGPRSKVSRTAGAHHLRTAPRQHEAAQSAFGALRFTLALDDHEPGEPVSAAEVLIDADCDVTSADLARLAIGEVYVGGGGADPIYRITRVEDAREQTS